MVKKQILSVGLFAASVLLAAAAVFLPVISFVSVLLAGIACAVSVILSSTPWVMAVGALVSFLLAWLLTGSASAALLFLVLFLPVGFALGLSFKNKKGLNDTVSFAVLNSAVLGTLALIVFIGEFSGGSFDVKEALDPVLSSFKSGLHTVFATDDPAATALMMSLGFSVESYIESLYYTVIFNIPMFYVSFILLLTVISYWTVKFIFKHTAEPIDFMGRFDGCRVSRLSAILYSIASLIYLFSTSSVFGLFIANYYNIMTCVLAYAGLSFIAYLLDLKNFSPMLKYGILIAAVALSFLPFGFRNLISLLGFFDACWNLRERIQNKGF